MRNYPTEQIIERKIFLIRGHKVMFDSDLAHLYGVESKNLNKAVQRNMDRFPPDFMFQLTREEFQALRFQIGTSNNGRGGRRYLPYVFTEQGVAILSSVLRSKRAARVNVSIMRAFVKLREILSTNEQLARKLHYVEQKLARHDARFKKHGREIRIIFEAIYELMDRPTGKIGF